ncbi:thioesterase II family protein [Corallococcus macrosporus]|uniref:Non-ribosomal peptide biosynthesis thioesterase n=1 Tax=Corallococcus macrosporus DSM 14697 TaxID=1189310 RepID=A0A250JVP5_9BACT|nr:alpha/beta fold hydrolase [Corallococcus macrosporus]ATB47934.1 non-ribosomal peptide biosynthesis thioesterase [Corallococcus macrosporus DSM 14697]
MTEWLAFHVPQPGAWARLFCLPHAGGSASLFRTWQAELGQDLEVCPVQLPGRENRLREAPLRTLPEVIAPLVEVVAKHADKPFALFGHSMGALLAYELTRALRERGLPAPLHLFVASYRAPHTLQAHTPATATHDIDASEARRLGESRAVSGEMAEELLTLMRATMLADTAVCEGYTWKQGPALTCPLSAFRGFDDYVPDDATEAWRQLSSGPFASQTFLGDHFFLRQTPRGLLQNIRRSLTRLRPASTR